VYTAGVTDPAGRLYVQARGVHPLRIVKQAVSMFLAAQPGLGSIDWNPLRRFVLRRDDPLPPGSPHILLYYNGSPTGRVVPWCGLSQLFRRIPVIALSEISFPPLGVVFASSLNPLFEGMQDITAWGSAAYRDEITTNILLPVKRIETDWPLGFGAPAEVERWKNEAGVMWFVAEADDITSLTSVAATWSREARG
jgi:hypothetical protein